MLMQIITVLAWIAIPATLIAVVDDWFLRPRRQLALAPQVARDPPFITAVYYALPVLIIAAVISLLTAEELDFSAVLLLIAAVTGVIWLVDVALFQRLRARAAQAQGKSLADIPEPGTVDYARSFFPVALAVLLLRAFVFEPFRIPSDSMMPTLLDGDFIIVNKFAYGLRLPVINRKVVSIGEPQRGDVVVFRYPRDPRINYIKRLVGLPGDRVQVKDDKLIVNGQPVPAADLGLYEDGCYEGMHRASEHLGQHTHEIMFCPTPGDIGSDPLPTCTRNPPRSYVCVAQQVPGEPDRGDTQSDLVVPPGSYLMIGDNRDNSEDGRYWGYVPEANLVGKATRIWFNWDWGRKGGPVWSRIGTRIE
ncbi:MAG TPA: signal peptidase I [Steroidobacteraceae bacterium]|jgi:signal peptidase I|nr:signal peptidase I [Steroidobacteraceae bacterium]